MPTHGHGHEKNVLAHVYNNNNNLGDGRAIRYIFARPNVLTKDAASIPVAAAAHFKGVKRNPLKCLPVHNSQTIKGGETKPP